jgi:hypothetical protein
MRALIRRLLTPLLAAALTTCAPAPALADETSSPQTVEYWFENDADGVTFLFSEDGICAKVKGKMVISFDSARKPLHFGCWIAIAEGVAIAWVSAPPGMPAVAVDKKNLHRPGPQPLPRDFT